MLQRNNCVIYYTKGSKTEPNNRKGNIMIGYTEIEKKYKEFEAQVKQVNEFWINAVISSLKQFVK